MRLICLTAGLALLATTAQAQMKHEHFEAETVGALHKLCAADEATSDGKYALGFCYGWIEGAGQFYEQLLLDERFDLKPAVCSDKVLTREDARTTFVAWAEANPEAAGEPALAGMFNAMKEAYPCK